MVKSRNITRVVPDGKKGWNVTQNGQTLGNHHRKETAVEHAMQIARRESPSQLVIHKQNGQFQTEHTYGNDPHPPEG